MTQRTKKSAPKVHRSDPPAVARTRRSTASAQPAPQPASTEGLDGALRALTLALEKKALEPILLDVRSLCSFTNYQLLLSGRSDRQVDAIADGIIEYLRGK